MKLLIVAVLICQVLVISSAASNDQLGRVGIYIYETIEGYHNVGAASGTAAADKILPIADGVLVVDKVPLESNESVRLLSELTEGREVTVSVISTTLTGNIVQAPVATFADDEIKFRDLTWHVELDKVMSDAKSRKLDQVLIGSISGQIRKTKRASKDGSVLLSVTAQGSFQLIDVSDGTAKWAKSLKQVQGGFDSDVAFADATVALGELIGKELVAVFQPQEEEGGR